MAVKKRTRKKAVKPKPETKPETKPEIKPEVPKPEKKKPERYKSVSGVVLSVVNKDHCKRTSILSVEVGDPGTDEKFQEFRAALKLGSRVNMTFWVE